ncbi:MAG: choice-of-anchor L domain-containing protein [Bacteroidales bacterium]
MIHFLRELVTVMYKYLFIFTTFILLHQGVSGQIFISPGPDVTPQDMVENIVGDGIIYDNVQFQGADPMRGIFTNGSTTNLGINSGIFLCSGSGYLIPGPNYQTAAGSNMGLGGHPSLDAITTATTYDAAVLSFDFVPESDTLKFKYVFGSEEYNEWVFSTFNDVFGYFVTGPNPFGGSYDDKNVAIVPGTANTTVTINNVNNGYSPGGVVPTGPCTNCDYYADNTNGLTLEYDGNTTVLTAWLLVVPCETYSIKIGVADAGDYNYDSGVFIEENSFECPQIEVETDPYPQGVSDKMIEGCVEADIIFTLPSAAYAPITVYFDLSESTAYPAAFPPGDFEEAIPDSVVFEDGFDSVAIHINPVYDGLIEGEETLRLIIENTLGCIVRWDTVDFIITDYTLLYNTITQNTIICEDMEIDLWVHVENGIPPYSYLWEPGGFTNDSITVSPDSTTTYFVNYTDMCQETGMDSTTVIVFPVCDFETFYFESALNPGLPYDIYGEVSNDTVLLAFPAGTNLNGLVASFTTDLEGCIPSIDGVLQESGVTANDFSDPLIYFFWGPGGCISEWTVIADIETGLSENFSDSFSVYPNPADDQLKLKLPCSGEVQIFNSLGQEMIRKKLDSPFEMIDVGTLEEGLYFSQFYCNQGLATRKFIIRR